jgi:hypothetical protein
MDAQATVRQYNGRKQKANYRAVYAPQACVGHDVFRLLLGMVTRLA